MVSFLLGLIDGLIVVPSTSIAFAYFSTVRSQNQFKIVENITKAVKNADMYFGQTAQNKSVT